MEVLSLVPSERIHERIAEQSAIIPAQQIKEAIVKVVQIISQERISGRIDEQIVDVAVPWCGKNSSWWRSRFQRNESNNGAGATMHVMEQFVDVFMPQIRQDIVEMAQVIPHKYISERIVEQMVDVSVLQILEKSVKVESVSPQKRKITNPFVELPDRQIIEFGGGRERSLTAAGAATRRGVDRRGSRAAHREGAP